MRDNVEIVVLVVAVDIYDYFILAPLVRLGTRAVAVLSVAVYPTFGSVRNIIFIIVR